MRVRPTHYSIRTRTDGNNRGNLQNWNIEGSNTGDDNDWKILDTHESEAQRAGQTATFNIRTNLEPNESYRYLRLRQTGHSTRKFNFLTLTSIEFFGTLFNNS